MQTPNTDYMAQLWERYRAFERMKLSLDMTRGNPSEEQLNLSDPMRAIMEYRAEDGSDTRNYNAKHFCGLPEARRLCARYLGTRWQETIVYGNSSLNLMADIVHWLRRAKWGRRILNPKFICVVPGYDRHFKMLTDSGITIVGVPMLEDGPDMEAVRKLVKDPSVVGMIIVPKYSNPTGNTYSLKVAREIARLQSAHPYFTVIVDDAYRYHDFTGTPDRPINFLTLAKEYGTEDRTFVFGSFSKVTLAGAGLAMMAMSERNFKAYSSQMATIGPDKPRQLQHVLFLKSLGGIKNHMRKHRRIVEPKFRLVYEVLEKTIGGKGIADWSRSEGGYFILVKLRHGSATRAYELTKALGVEFTKPGAPFPGGKDPEDKYWRVPPTYPPLIKLRPAIEVQGLCMEIAHREKFPN